MARYVQPNFIVDSSAAFLRNTTFNSSTYLSGTTFITTTGTGAAVLPYALVVDTTGANIQIKSKQLGSMAFEASTNYVGYTAYNASIGALWAYNVIQDASIAKAGIAWNGLTKSVDSSIGLGGALNIPTTITTSATNTLALTGLQTGTSRLAVISNAGVLQTQQLGTAALEASTAFATAGALGNYVLKTGDTMSGALTISAGGLSVTNNVSIGGSAVISQNLYVGGDFTVDGCIFSRGVETIDVSAAYIYLNTGLSGAPAPTMQSGIVIDRGTSSPYVFLYDESGKQFRIGESSFSGGQYVDASTQAVATREDAPNANGIAWWNATANRFDTSIGFKWIQGAGGGLYIPVVLPSATTQFNALIWDGTSVGYRTLSNHAFDTSVWVLQSLFDSSIGGIYNSITNLSTNKLDAVATVTGVAGGHEIYSGEANNIAYIKKIVQGTGATIISDSSTITISVTGAAGYMSKYRSTFDGTSGTSFGIPGATHGLGTGPFLITVYEFNEIVYTGVYVNPANGDVSITWGAGALTDASCKFIISG